MSVQVRVSQFHYQLMFPNEDFSWTWDEHGGLTGHIEYNERLRLKNKRLELDQLRMEYIIANQDKFPALTVLKDVFNILSIRVLCPATRSSVHGFWNRI